MRKKIIVFTAALLVCISVVAVTVFADTAAFTGTIPSSKTLTLTITGLDANTLEVKILAVNVANSNDVLMDTALADNETATQTFTEPFRG